MRVCVTSHLPVLPPPVPSLASVWVRERLCHWLTQHRLEAIKLDYLYQSNVAVHTTFVVYKNKYVLLNGAFPRKRKMKARSGRRGGMQLLWLTQLREITMYVQRSVLSVQMFVYLVS